MTDDSIAVSIASECGRLKEENVSLRHNIVELVAENERLLEALELIATGDLRYPEQEARLALKGETE